MAPGQIPQGYQGQTGGYNPAAQAPGQQQAPGYPGYQQPAPQGNSMYNPYNMHGKLQNYSMLPARMISFLNTGRQFPSF